MLLKHTTLFMLLLICAESLKEQEKLLAQRKIPGLKSQLEEYKSALCQLQVQKQCLQNDVSHHDKREVSPKFLNQPLS